MCWEKYWCSDGGDGASIDGDAWRWGVIESLDDGMVKGDGWGLLSAAQKFR